ncbi:hypothetical protein HAHE_09880 [Haloferula helveola]|uniref:Secreted protein n=1 Tax=Haloferula helveola TaxID=490095 RepID=A0ABN6H0L0_9BACT|nr:hypothetical protein HAHE_09880 [Haloferula helveola]
MVRSLRRLWIVIVILACLIAAAISFIAGYLTALRRVEMAGPVFTQQPLPPSSPEGVGGGEATTPPDAPEEPEDPPEPTETEDPASREVLEAFLSAPDWKSRMDYVANGPAVEEAMEAEAGGDGDGPIEVTDIESTLLDDDLHHFRVKTEAIPDGFPVTLRETPDGWKIDWATFDEFHRDRFRSFVASAEAGDVGEFHVFVRPTDGDHTVFAQYQLSAPIKGRSYPSFAKRSGPAHAKLTALVSSDEVQNDERYQKLLERDGLPLVVRISCHKNSQDQRYLLIDDLVATHWGPAN